MSDDDRTERIDLPVEDEFDESAEGAEPLRRTKPLDQVAFVAFAQEALDSLREHQENGLKFGLSETGVRAWRDQDGDLIYCARAKKTQDIIGVLLIGRPVMATTHRALYAAFGLLPLEIEALEDGWCGVKGDGDSRFLALGASLAVEFLT
jgi:hypothetical protein